MVQARSLPKTISPMLARLTRQPFDSPDHLFELKWDGIRALAFVDGGKLRLQGRDLKDLTPLFPELTGLPEMVETHDTVLDGELVCFDNDGKPSLELMHRRLKRQAEGRVVRNPKVHFVAFDLLFLGGSSVMDEPLSLRKTLLQEVVRPSENVQACEFIDTEGRAFFQATCDLGLEGIMAKNKSGVYLAGKRSPGWQKIKRARECEFVIGGYAFGGRRREPYSSLLLGLYDDGQGLVFAGQVSTELSRPETRRLYETLEQLHTPDCPFTRPPRPQAFTYWCEPALVCNVEYGEFTTNGLLRYPVFVSFRDDKPPLDCRIVDAPGWPTELGWSVDFL